MARIKEEVFRFKNDAFRVRWDHDSSDYRVERFTGKRFTGFHIGQDHLGEIVTQGKLLCSAEYTVGKK